MKVAEYSIAWGHGLDYNPRYKLLAVGGLYDARVYVLDVSELVEGAAGEAVVPRVEAAPMVTPVVPVAVGYAGLLGRPVKGFVSVEKGLADGFTARLPRGIAPEGYEGVWECFLLGSGGWGSVYLARRDGRAVVFKVPRGFEGLVEGGEIPTVSGRLMERVVGRAEAVACLNHPHVLKLLGYSRSVPLLVYEYADGGSLEDQRGRGWEPSLRDVLLIGVQIGDALRYVHSRGLVHGDLKAGDVFVVNGVVKLGDFSGLMKLLSKASSRSSFTYTYGWRAPEQAYSDLRLKAKELGFENRIDVYLLGNLLLYLLTGETVDGEDRVDEEVFEEVVGMVEHEGVRRVIEAMMRLNPWERPAADEVVRMLAALYGKLGGG